MDNFEWNFYAVNKNNMLIMGFEDEHDARDYCKNYNFRMFTRNGLRNKKINPRNLDRWVYEDETPEYEAV